MNNLEEKPYAIEGPVVNDDGEGEYKGGQKFTVKFVYDKVKDYEYVCVKYTATLNKNCVVEELNTKKAMGNPNRVTLQYTNNYTKETTAEKGPREVRTYTYRFPIYKFTYDATGNKESLAGAQFVVYKQGTEEYVQYKKEKIEKAPDEEDEEKVVSVYNETGVTVSEGDESHTYHYVFTSDAEGYIYLAGLDAGTTYVVKEIVAPEGGYTLAPETTFTITAEPGANGAQEIRSDKNAQKAANDPTGNVKEGGADQIEVENTKDITLPTTGGIGTTIFYVLGALLVVIAGVVLVTRRRMNGK